MECDSDYIIKYSDWPKGYKIKLEKFYKANKHSIDVEFHAIHLSEEVGKIEKAKLEAKFDEWPDEKKNELNNYCASEHSLNDILKKISNINDNQTAENEDAHSGNAGSPADFDPPIRRNFDPSIRHSFDP